MIKEVLSINFFLSVLAVYLIFSTSVFSLTHKIFSKLNLPVVSNGAITQFGLFLHSVVAVVVLQKVVPEVVRMLNKKN